MMDILSLKKKKQFEDFFKCQKLGEKHHGTVFCLPRYSLYSCRSTKMCFFGIPVRVGKSFQ